jgi:hypothetical protein
MIPEYSKQYFEIKDDDTEEAILNKRYLMSRNNIGKKIELEYRLNDFHEKYAEIKKMKDKTTLEKLQRQLVIEELFE